MHSQTMFFRWVAFLSVLILAGCNLPANPTPTALIPPAPTASQAIGVTPTTTATATALPTGTPTQTLTSLPPTSTSTVTTSPTPTVTSTNTPIPRVSSVAAFLSKPPSIDGDWDEWTTTQYPIKHVVFGGANWTGAKDLQAAYRVGWDTTYLYLAVKVNDDGYVQNATGANLFQGDSIEVLLSTQPDADSPSLGLTAADYQIGISPGHPNVGENMEAYRWYPKAKAGHLTNVAIGAIPTSFGYRIEFSIPWSVFAVTPTRGDVFGFAVSVSDNDNKTENIQQTLISSTPRRKLTDPTTWGLLTLK